MRGAFFRALLVPLAVTGCAAVPDPVPVPISKAPTAPPRPVTRPAQPIEQAAATAPAEPKAYTLDHVTQMALSQHPRLGEAAFGIDAARGRAVQAGLYPNPTVSVTGDELGDRTGPGGIWTTPQVSQELVTAGKLGLSRAAATREVDQATLQLMTQRYSLVGSVRSSYFDVLTLQERIEILTALVKLAEQSVEQTRKLLEAKLVARLDLVQLEVEVERLRTELEAAERELPGAFKRLAATAGVSQLPYARLHGSLEEGLPDYELERTQRYVLSVHPEVKSALAGVERARLLVRRAEVDPIPNVTVSTGYVRQNQNRSDDWVLSASVPVPVWNRNQGNIMAARAELGQATQVVGRVENELAERVATAFRDYAAAKRRAERYRDAILPRARETYELSAKAYQGGQFEYLRVLEAQRAVAQANLEYVRAMGEAWRAAGVISGLALEDVWPPPPPAQPRK